MRSASSSKRSDGSPTQRISRFAMSSLPPNGSTSPFSGLHAIAFTVKSRRERSETMSRTKLTLCGCLPSFMPQSARKVVSSKGTPSKTAVTVPNFKPVSIIFANGERRRLVSSGEAETAKSISWTGRPIRLSRTKPPTAYASIPDAESISNRRRAVSFGLIIFRRFQSSFYAVLFLFIISYGSIVCNVNFNDYCKASDIFIV